MRSDVRRMLVAVAVAGIATVAATAHAEPSGKWRIKFNHQADNDGTIVLRVAPIDGTAIDVETKVPAKTRENRVADLVRDSLQVTLGSKNFRIGVDDGEDVIIKKRGKTRNFELTMVSTSLTGLEIEIKHD